MRRHRLELEKPIAKFDKRLSTPLSSTAAKAFHVAAALCKVGRRPPSSPRPREAKNGASKEPCLLQQLLCVAANPPVSEERTRAEEGFLRLSFLGASSARLGLVKITLPPLERKHGVCRQKKSCTAGVVTMNALTSGAEDLSMMAP